MILPSLEAWIQFGAACLVFAGGWASCLWFNRPRPEDTNIDLILEAAEKPYYEKELV